MKQSLVAFSLIVAASLPGCATMSEADIQAKVLNQAAFDLNCDSADLSVQKISDDAEMMGVKNHTWGVRGCEKQATYKTSCRSADQCTVLNEGSIPR